ncbi:MAG: CsbD family protein [Planctomycetes bacterium]|nr:CsbD family protein [Planctomycetota bacterium]
MNWTQIEGRWEQVKGKVRDMFGKLTDDDVERIKGNKDKFAGALKERYGYEKEEADSHLQRFADSLREPAKSGKK